jgi:hypothetical protein
MALPAVVAEKGKIEWFVVGGMMMFLAFVRLKNLRRMMCPVWKKKKKKKTKAWALEPHVYYHVMAHPKLSHFSHCVVCQPREAGAVSKKNYTTI